MFESCRARQGTTGRLPAPELAYDLGRLARGRNLGEHPQ